MNFDLENSFPLVYLSGPLIITHGRRGPAPADPPPPPSLPPSGPGHAQISHLSQYFWYIFHL